MNKTIVGILVVLFLGDRLLKELSNKTILNQGSSFSLPFWSLILAGGFFLILVIYFLFYRQREDVLALILGGGSNFYDHLKWGGVVDYIKLWIIDLNLADLLITLGVVFWLISLFNIYGDKKSLLG